MNELPLQNHKGEELDLFFALWQPPEETEVIRVDEAADRVLAEDIFSQATMPVVRASLMDGIAVNASLFADGIPDASTWVLNSEYAWADTGDDFDDTFNAVILRENVEFLDAGGLRFSPELRVEPGQNIRTFGADVEKGEQVGRQYQRLHPKDLARLLMGGHICVRVLKKPRIAVIPTGNELVPPGMPLARGQYTETNSIFLRESLKRLGTEPVCLPIVKDNPGALEVALNTALTMADMVIITGGTSRGRKDLNQGMLLRRGKSLYHGRNARQGKPVRIALVDNKPVLNLPGPPASLYQGMEWCAQYIVCRFLHQPMPQRQKVKAALTSDLSVPESVSSQCKMEITRNGDGTLLATPLDTRHIPAWQTLNANGLYLAAIAGEFLPKGSEIEVELLRAVEPLVG